MGRDDPGDGDSGGHSEPQNSRTEKNLFVMYFADARAGWAICGESR